MKAFGMPLPSNQFFMLSSGIFGGVFAGGLIEVFRDADYEEYFVVDHHPEKAKSPLDSHEFYKQFWASDQEHKFYVYSTKKAHKYKFREWLEKSLKDAQGRITRREFTRF